MLEEDFIFFGNFVGDIIFVWTHISNTSAPVNVIDQVLRKDYNCILDSPYQAKIFVCRRYIYRTDRAFRIFIKSFLGLVTNEEQC